jgi:hypothetical protein
MENNTTTKRVPYRASINGTRNRLTVRGKDPAFEYRIVNDDEDRVLTLQERGYEIVTHAAEIGDKRVATPRKEGAPVQISVGGGKKAYLMRTKKEWYDEDQAEKAKQIDAIENSLNGTPNDGYGKVEIAQRDSSK